MANIGKYRLQPVIVQALNEYWPTASWGFEDPMGDSEELYVYANLSWQSEDVTKPTEEELNAKIALVQADLDATQYSEDRKEAYPDIGEQLDMLWHAIDAGTLDKTSDFYTTIKAVKDNNPKP